VSELRQCRVLGCNARHPRTMFCCRSHWFALPRSIRDAIWRAHRSREGIFGEAYRYSAAAADGYLAGRFAPR
jgi:hypothetical protein